jgi:hypothetical protein
MVFGERKMVMGIQPAVVSAAQRVERSEFKHDRLLKGSSWGGRPGHEARPWLMTGIIHQASIDKKRKKCRITIEMADKLDPQNILISPSVHRIS